MSRHVPGSAGFEMNKRLEAILEVETRLLTPRLVRSFINYLLI